MQAMRRPTQAPAYKSRRTDPAPDFFTYGTLGTPYHEWIGVRQSLAHPPTLGAVVRRVALDYCLSRIIL